ncbi:HTH_Tnp_Tc3_2 domain-containing protein [Trichonephila clavipes]|nr:HTH_Tnp_Tc3_2 domain-containing protein [Trichonephila clavipes]
MSFKPRSGSGRHRQTSHREDRHMVRNARAHPTASSAAVHAHVVPSLGSPLSSRTIRKRLAEEHLGSWHPLRVLTNPDSISAVMTIVFVNGDPVVNASILTLLYSNTPLPQLV